MTYSETTYAQLKVGDSFYDPSDGENDRSLYVKSEYTCTEDGADSNAFDTDYGVLAWFDDTDVVWTPEYAAQAAPYRLMCTPHSYCELPKFAVLERIPTMREAMALYDAFESFANQLQFGDTFELSIEENE